MKKEIIGLILLMSILVGCNDLDNNFNDGGNLT